MRYITRNEIYALVWKVPPGKLMRRLNLSNQDLVAVCAVLSVQMPSLSFWMRRKRGEDVAPTKLVPTNGPVELWLYGSRIELEPPAVFDRARTRPESLLSFDDVETLTGRKNTRLQCESLVAMKIPFAINVIGEPLVPRSAINGTKAEARREVKLLHESMELAMRNSADHHRQSYRERVKKLTDAP